jgi:hypothetical protein
MVYSTTLERGAARSMILEHTMIGTLLTFFAVGLVTLIVLGVVLSIVGTVFSLFFGIATFLLFKVAPILLVGWVVLKLLDRRKPKGELSAADREWLEGGK